MVCVLETSLASSTFRARVGVKRRLPARGVLRFSLECRSGWRKRDPQGCGRPSGRESFRRRSEGCGGAWARPAKQPGGGTQGGAAPPARGERRAPARGGRVRNRALGLELRRLPWAYSERHWCDFSGRSVSSVTMKGRAAACFGVHGRSAEAQPGRLGRLDSRVAARRSQSPRGWGWEVLRRSPFRRSPQSFRNPKSLFTNFSFQLCN